MAQPIGNTGSREAKHLSTMSMPEMFDLQKRVFADSTEVKDIQASTGALMSLFKADPFTGTDGGWKTVIETDSQTFGNEQPEGSNPQMIKYGIGRTLNYTYIDYGNSISVTARAMRDNKYAEVFKRLTELPRLMMNRRYLDGVHQFTFGMVDSYTNLDGRVVSTLCVDGVRPFFNAHTLVHSTRTWTNIVPSNPSFSKAGLLAAELLFKTQIMDNFGIEKPVTPTHLITTNDPTLVYNVRQILGSVTELGQTNANVINALNKYQHVILPRMDSTSLGAYDSTKKDMYVLGRFGTSDGVDIRFSEAEGITMKAPHVDEMNGNVTSRVEGSWIFKMVSARAMVTSNGTGI